jgi:hypothetical protein
MKLRFQALGAAGAVSAMALCACESNTQPARSPNAAQPYPGPGYAQQPYGSYPPASYPPGQQYPQQQYPQQQYPNQPGQYPPPGYQQQPYPQQYPNQPYPPQAPQSPQRPNGAPPASAPQQPAPQQPAPQQPGPQQPGPTPASPAAPAPTGFPWPFPALPLPSTVPATPAPSTLPSLPGGVNLPLAALDANWLKAQAQGVLADLTRVLPPAAQHHIQGVPLVFEGEVGEVNAFAACAKGRSFLAITEPLLEIIGWLAQTKARDEAAGTQLSERYIDFVLEHMQPKSPLPRPQGWSAPGGADPRVLARQQVLLEEQIAFVVGHELAHHYLSHLPCTGGSGPLESGWRAASGTVPVLNQPNELAADGAGIENLLSAGRQRPSPWNEEGALLVMRFFEKAGPSNPLRVILDFERTHPPAALRKPVIEAAAATWRRTGGVGVMLPNVRG